MIVLDVNVLVSAYVAGHPHHARARAFLTRALSDNSVLVPDLVWAGFLRVVTNARIFDNPASAREAIEFIGAATGSPGYRTVAGLSDGIEPFLQLVADAEASGDLVPDAYIAAVARVHDCAVATFDRDFRRFDDLRIVVPA